MRDNKMAKRPIDNRLDFLSPVSLVPKLGPRRVSALKESGIENIHDLLYRFPRRYIDRSVIVSVGDLHKYAGSVCCCTGTVTRTRVERGRKPRFRIQIADDTGELEALWFSGIQYFRMSIHTGQCLLLTGAVSVYNNVQMVHPSIESIGADENAPKIKYLPQYSISEAMREAGFGQKAMLGSIRWILDNLKHYPQILPEKIERKKNFFPLNECLREIHLPQNLSSIGKYSDRVRYEELYQLALTLRWSKRKFLLPGRSMDGGQLPETFKKSLPFKLTKDQDAAVELLYRDAKSKHRMHRLLQGDVGSGKTVVAFFACLPALNSGMQVAWMAPTETLAIQTYQRISEWLDIFGLSAQLLTGSTEPAEKQHIKHECLTGLCRFIIGTHALIMPEVKFLKLGMIVIDEQQKFGSGQRTNLAEKDPASDFLLMSATPIPQTLAKTLYGDLDIVSIKSLPEGRKPVQTFLVPEKKRHDMESYLQKQIETEGALVYYVVPRIESTDESEKLKDITETFASLDRGLLAAVPKTMVHGKMKSIEKETQFQRFASGEVKLLVATSLIEVGLDVAAASIIVIENAERFGLSQLHQLRGRVGRGNQAGYCFLLTGENIDEIAKKRLESFCKTHDGFEIADLDLELRGPGEVVGLRQSGWDDLKIADIMHDAAIFREILEELDLMLGH